MRLQVEAKEMILGKCLLFFLACHPNLGIKPEHRAILKATHYLAYVEANVDIVTYVDELSPIAFHEIVGYSQIDRIYVHGRPRDFREAIISSGNGTHTPLYDTLSIVHEAAHLSLWKREKKMGSQELAKVRERAMAYTYLMWAMKHKVPLHSDDRKLMCDYYMLLRCF